MSFHIELRCDLTASPTCVTKLGNSPTLVAPRLKNVQETTRQLQVQARHGGWWKTHEYGWVCPQCKWKLKDLYSGT